MFKVCKYTMTTCKISKHIDKLINEAIKGFNNAYNTNISKIDVNVAYSNGKFTWTISEGVIVIDFNKIDCSSNEHLVDVLVHYALSLVLECNLEGKCGLESINKKIDKMVIALNNVVTKGGRKVPQQNNGKSA